MEMLKKSYWEGTGKHEELLTKLKKASPDWGYTGNGYLDCYIAFAHLYYDAYNNGGGNIKDCYKKDVKRYILPLFSDFDWHIFYNCQHAEMEEWGDRIIERVANEDIRYLIWQVDFNEQAQELRMHDPVICSAENAGSFEEKAEGWSSITFGDVRKRDEWVAQRRRLWSPEARKFAHDLSEKMDETP